MPFKLNPFTGKLDVVNDPVSPGGSDTQIQYNDGGSFGGANNFVWDDVNERVGIGTTTPGAKLEVVYDGTNNYSTLNGGSLLLKTNANSTTALTVNGTGEANLVDIQDNGSSVFMVKDGGNIGIGTTSPSEKLVIGGDNDKLAFGAGEDASIYYDGSNLVINPKEVGSGYVQIDGQVLATDKIMFTQTDGNEYIDSLADGYMDYGATTAHRFDNDIVVNSNLTLRSDGTIAPVSMADASASNNSIYYSTDASKLVYKDSGGTVNNLY